MLAQNYDRNKLHVFRSVNNTIVHDRLEIKSSAQKIRNTVYNVKGNISSNDKRKKLPLLCNSSRLSFLFVNNIIDNIS